MSAEFREFTEAVAKASTKTPVTTETPLSRVAVLGGGADACLLAALCLAEGAEVNLFSAYGAELEQLRLSSGITLRGAGPVGTYQIDRDDATSIQTTAELDRAIADAELIFLTGPVHKQRTYAMVLASHVQDGQIIVLAPGSSLAAMETAWYLRIGGCVADVTVIETQGLPYWFDAQGAHLQLTESAPVYAASLPAGRHHALQQLKRFLPNIVSCDSVLWSGFADGSGLVEVPALLLNGAGLQRGDKPIPMGAQRLPENDTFAALIGSQQRAVIERLADERRSVAALFGVRNLPDTDDWIRIHAGAVRGDGSRSIPSESDSLSILRDAVIGSLVPLLSAASLTESKVPATESIVTLVSTILGADIAAAGRRLDSIGITSGNIDTARRTMDDIAMGPR